MNDTLDNLSVYNKDILPLIKQIGDICKKHQIAMVASFECGKDDFWTTSYLPDGCSLSLRNAKQALLDENCISELKNL